MKEEDKVAILEKVTKVLVEEVDGKMKLSKKVIEIMGKFDK